jgi:Cell division protein FtsI/penicillin-binding protein 2
MAIVQDPYNGHILAAASYPVQDGMSLPFQFTYEPGSTFKTISISAALDSGNTDMNATFNMENNNWVLNNVVIKDHERTKDVLTLSEVMEVSSNIGAGKIAYAMGAKTLYSYLKKYGFGIKSNVDFLGESSGILRDYTTWRPLDTAKAGYGYTVAVTGVQLVNAYSAVANGGTLMQAHLVDKIRYANGEEKVFADPIKVRRVITPKTDDEMRYMLQNVVIKGTGLPAQIKGYTVAGKTGTTEKYVGGGKYGSSHIASFCGFVPAIKPRFTILVVLDQPEQALFGTASARIFSEIAKKFLTLYGVPPDQENYAS